MVRHIIHLRLDIAAVTVSLAYEKRLHPFLLFVFVNRANIHCHKMLLSYPLACTVLRYNRVGTWMDDCSSSTASHQQKRACRAYFVLRPSEQGRYRSPDVNPAASVWAVPLLSSHPLSTHPASLCQRGINHAVRHVRHVTLLPMSSVRNQISETD